MTGAIKVSSNAPPADRPTGTSTRSPEARRCWSGRGKPVRPWTRRSRGGLVRVAEHVAVDGIDRLAGSALPGAAGFRCETSSGGSSAMASIPSGRVAVPTASWAGRRG